MWMRYTSEAEQVIASLCVMQDYGLRRRKEENRGDQNPSNNTGGFDEDGVRMAIDDFD